MNLIAIASQLSELNQRLEEGEGLDQLVVVVSSNANDEEIEQAKLQACEDRGVDYEGIGQVVIVKTEDWRSLGDDLSAHVQVVQ